MISDDGERLIPKPHSHELCGQKGSCVKGFTSEQGSDEGNLFCVTRLVSSTRRLGAVTQYLRGGAKTM